MSREKRIKQHIDTLMEMKEAMLKSDDWENLTRLIDACVAGGMALQASLEDGKYVSMKKIEEIKAEINEERECAYADFERYKVEYLGQDWEDVLDSLPQDDFRYGMERCLEIINKHIGKEQE